MSTTEWVPPSERVGQHLENLALSRKAIFEQRAQQLAADPTDVDKIQYGRSRTMTAPSRSGRAHLGAAPAPAAQPSPPMLRFTFGKTAPAPVESPAALRKQVVVSVAAPNAASAVAPVGGRNAAEPTSSSSDAPPRAPTIDDVPRQMFGRTLNEAERLVQLKQLQETYRKAAAAYERDQKKKEQEQQQQQQRQQQQSNASGGATPQVFNLRAKFGCTTTTTTPAASAPFRGRSATAAARTTPSVRIATPSTPAPAPAPASRHQPASSDRHARGAAIDPVRSSSAGSERANVMSLVPGGAVAAAIRPHSGPVADRQTNARQQQPVPSQAAFRGRSQTSPMAVQSIKAAPKAGGAAAAPPKQQQQQQQQQQQTKKRNPNECMVCERVVYAMEQVRADDHVFHKWCFRCAVCNARVTPGNYAAVHQTIYCKTHFKQLFKLKGNYDEAFGCAQRKKDWGYALGGATPDQEAEA